MEKETDKVPEYTNVGLRKKDLDKDPVKQFSVWYEEACKLGPLEATAMALSTVSREGQPSLRTVLLKGVDARGFVFFTNQESTKAGQIANNPKVALLFHWLPLHRQVIILGTAKKISSAESLKYFVTRTPGSQLGAWASRQSSVIASRQLLEEKFMEIKRKFADGDIPLPSFWGGYRVTPRSMEFWNGRPDRMHDRFLYSRHKDNTWNLERLSP